MLMTKAEANDYDVFRRNHAPTQVWVDPQPVTTVEDLVGPFHVAAGERVPARGDCVCLWMEGVGSVIYGWVHDVTHRLITVKHYAPALLAMKEAIADAERDTDR